MRGNVQPTNVRVHLANPGFRRCNRDSPVFWTCSCDRRILRIDLRCSYDACNARGEESGVSTDVAMFSLHGGYQDSTTEPLHHQNLFANAPPPQVPPAAPSPQSARRHMAPQYHEYFLHSRVEGHGRYLSAQRASQTRRKTPRNCLAKAVHDSCSSCKFHAAHFVPPTSPAFRSSRTVSDTPLANSLIEQSENAEQMAASQRRLFEQMVTLRTRLNERLAASNKFAKFLESTLQARDKDIKHANERLVAAMLEG